MDAAELSGALKGLESNLDKVLNFATMAPTFELAEAKLRTQDAMERVTRDFLSGKLDNDYVDGDQSPVSHTEAHILRAQWGSGADYNPFYNPCMSQWSVDCFNGELEKLRRHVADDARVVELRETVMHVSGIFHVIAGASTLLSARAVPHAVRVHVVETTDHVGCAHFLANEVRARIDARDFAGFSPLHHCVGRYSNAVTLEIASIILGAGADVDAKNRLGESPVFEAVRAENVDAVRLLVENGAGLDIVNNSGVPLPTVATGKPEITAMLEEYAVASSNCTSRSRTNMEECASCQQLARGNARRCTGCFELAYCCVGCQKLHWPVHKESCKAAQKKFKPVAFESKSDKSEERRIKKRELMTIKLQLPMDLVVSLNERADQVDRILADAKADTTTFLLVYNRDKSVYGCIRPSCEHFDEIVHLVHSRGVGGFRAYFDAIYTKDSRLLVDISAIITPEAW